MYTNQPVEHQEEVRIGHLERVPDNVDLEVDRTHQQEGHLVVVHRNHPAVHHKHQQEVHWVEVHHSHQEVHHSHQEMHHSHQEVHHSHQEVLHIHLEAERLDLEVRSRNRNPILKYN